MEVNAGFGDGLEQVIVMEEMKMYTLRVQDVKVQLTEILMKWLWDIRKEELRRILVFLPSAILSLVF